MNKISRLVFLIIAFFAGPLLYAKTENNTPDTAAELSPTPVPSKFDVQKENIVNNEPTLSDQTPVDTDREDEDEDTDDDNDDDDETDDTTHQASSLPEQQKNIRQPAAPEDALFDFNLDNTDLVDIINRFAALKSFNVAFPTVTQGGPITQKITFKNTKKISLKDMEKYVYTFLELSGYALISDQSSSHKKTTSPHEKAFFFKLIKTDSGADTTGTSAVSREPLPLYINVPPSELPASEMRIRAVYYLANIKVPDTSAGASQSPLELMLKDMISPSGKYLFDPKSNGIIISDKATTIASIMTIVNELDSSGVRDTVEVVRLYNAGAATIADLLKTQQGLAIGGQRAGAKGDSGSYFSTNIRIVADTRQNSLILMGRSSAIERLKEFVVEYLDLPLESGKSILHYYDLQYLDAEQFAGVLTQIVNRQTDNSQSKQVATGPESFFQGVIIKAEVPKAVEKAAEAQVATTKTAGPEEIIKGTVYKGGNRLIVAARAQDWERIKMLIQQLDTPQPQVILEVLVADIVVEDDRILGAQTRNPAELDLPNGVNFQSGQLVAPFTNQPPTTLAPDLLEEQVFNGTMESIAAFLSSGFPGSLIISLNDPAGTGIWSVLQVLQQYNNTKVISHPFLVTLNNKEGHEVVSEIRRDFGDVNPATGAASVINQVDVTAALKIAIVPRISPSDRVNLQITVNINQFVNGNPASTNLTINTRQIETNANLHTGQILILGGLTQITATESENETPILSRIPILGWLFKKEQRDIVKNNLAVFICPTVIRPRIRDAQHSYTKRKVEEAYDAATENSGLLFDNLRDPVTNFFFNPKGDDDGKMVDNYLADARDTGLLLDRHSSLIQNRKVRPKKVCKKEKRKEVTRPTHNLKDMLADQENPLLTVK
jgi:general secretion pathway protein D